LNCQRPATDHVIIGLLRVLPRLTRTATEREQRDSANSCKRHDVYVVGIKIKPCPEGPKRFLFGVSNLIGDSSAKVKNELTAYRLRAHRERDQLLPLEARRCVPDNVTGTFAMSDLPSVLKRHPLVCLKTKHILAVYAS
jgi:hypothetical protein